MGGACRLGAGRGPLADGLELLDPARSVLLGAHGGALAQDVAGHVVADLDEDQRGGDVRHAVHFDTRVTGERVATTFG